MAVRAVPPAVTRSGDPVKVRDDVLAVNHLMRQPITEDEAERVIHALGLTNYEITKRAPEKAKASSTTTTGAG